MRTVLIAAVLAGCTRQSRPAAQSAGEEDRYRNDTTGAWRHDAGVDAPPAVLAGDNELQHPEGTQVTMPEREYTVGADAGVDATIAPSYEMRETKAVAGVHVTAVPNGVWQVWAVEIENRTGDAIDADWDRSAFVMPDGESSRIIRGETRRMDTGKAQPKTSIIPGAHINEVLIPEVFTDILDALGREGPDVDPPEGLIGARLVIAIERGGATKLWTGTIAKKRARKK